MQEIGMLALTHQPNTGPSAFHPTPMFDGHELRGREEQEAIIAGSQGS